MKKQRILTPKTKVRQKVLKITTLLRKIEISTKKTSQQKTIDWYDVTRLSNIVSELENINNTLKQTNE